MQFAELWADYTRSERLPVADKSERLLLDIIEQATALWASPVKTLADVAERLEIALFLQERDASGNYTALSGADITTRANLEALLATYNWIRDHA